MTSSTLRQSGRSLVLTIPKAFAEQLGLRAGRRVDITISGNELRMRPVREARLTLEELLRNTPATAEVTDRDSAPAMSQE